MLNQFELSKLKLKRPNLKWVVGLGIALMIGTGLIALRLNSSRPTSSGSTPTTSSPLPSTVNALGRLEPQGEVINVSAPSQSMGGSQVMELRVKEGDRVQAGQILAVLDSRDRLQASLLEAQQQVQVTRSRLEDIRAGAKRGEITAAQAEIQNLEAQLAGELKTQQATIDRLKAELQNAEIELQ
ncbi:MAG: biotin/lipoyl-binding protein, partial [Phormidesmis sp. CAN_BIN44]|nr:biotin/lipoyl-binding protein [Phormidesmis sp. CAN_BIN44]